MVGTGNLTESVAEALWGSGGGFRAWHTSHDTHTTATSLRRSGDQNLFLADFSSFFSIYVPQLVMQLAMRAVFRVWNASSHSLVHLNSRVFSVRRVNGNAIRLYDGMKAL